MNFVITDMVCNRMLDMNNLSRFEMFMSGTGGELTVDCDT